MTVALLQFWRAILEPIYAVVDSRKSVVNKKSLKDLNPKFNTPRGRNTPDTRSNNTIFCDELTDEAEVNELPTERLNVVEDSPMTKLSAVLTYSKAIIVTAIRIS